MTNSPNPMEPAHAPAGAVNCRHGIGGISISGEHGIGLEKSEFLSLCFSSDDIETMIAVRHAIDPDELSNPQKIFPDSRTCNEAGRKKFMKIPTT